ncbi:hypothetical protein [Dyadobacter sp. CY347]|uniref:hypothetical protein n=1 Tax=Dyadobacter sp. CY347 TaxID=2909336 RepID=UPI001F47DD78|nr:hypothetical protein [Dyadobacter sp. CY347]MCF2486546.1 hypothetical protein [Dyadobacter sp. CY347]
MKKIILSITLMAILGMAGAQASTISPAKFASCVSQDKVAVRPDDLPEAVKNTLSGDAYADWKVTSAFLVTKEDNSQYFEINARKGEESTVVNLDKYGKKVD